MGRESQSRKEMIIEQTLSCLETSGKSWEFSDALRSKGLELYVRGEKSVSVRDYHDIMKNGKPRVHRLEKLGLLKSFQDKQKQWEREMEMELQKEAPEMEFGE